MSLYSVAARRANQLFGRFGYQMIRLPSPAWNCRMKTLQAMDIDLVFDVGANAGQYALELRSYGFAGDIISFEPQPDAFAVLARHAAREDRWQVHNAAVGAKPGRLSMNIAANSVSSSLLQVGAAHLSAVPDSRTTDAIDVDVITLEPLLVAHAGRRIMMKIDTQGYELPVLQGCGAAIDTVLMLDTEMSLTEVYEGQQLFADVDRWIERAGFHIRGIDTSFWDRNTGALLCLDGIYARDADAVRLK